MKAGHIAGIPTNMSETVSRIFGRHSWIRKVVLYGSRAKGTFKDGSDIDLTLVSDSPVSLAALNQVELDLDGLDLPWNIDLSVYEDIENPALLNHIDRVGIAIYER